MMTCNSPLLLERQSHGWNITQMAKYLGVDPTAYHEIEQGYRVPAKVTRERISQKLGISEEILFADAVFIWVCVRCGRMFEAEHPRRKTCNRCRDMGTQDNLKYGLRRGTGQERIARLAREAREAGMSYGQYVTGMEKGKKK